MAKQWFRYLLTNATCPPQKTATNYQLVGVYPLPNDCILAAYTCLIYSFYTTIPPTPVRPAPAPGGSTVGLSANIQAYITAICSGGGPVQAQPISGKKYVYVKG